MIVSPFSRLPNKLYRLRWRFTYSDHKPDVYGVWDERSDKQENKASFQSKINIDRALIEGVFTKDDRIKQVFVDIPGHLMKHVQCMCFGTLSNGEVLSPKSTKLRSFLSAMYFQTDTHLIGVQVNGEKFTQVVTPHQVFKSFEHSAGV